MGGRKEGCSEAGKQSGQLEIHVSLSQIPGSTPLRSEVGGGRWQLTDHVGRNWALGVR